MEKLAMRKFVWLLPILVFYVVVCVVFADSALENDQARYAMYARNLVKGFYAPRDTLCLWNGPGYPLLLVPFVAADVPLIWAKYLNSLLVFGAVCFVYFALREYMSERKALLGAYALGFYVPFLWEMTLLLTESLAIFLVAGFCFFVVKYFRKQRFGYAAAAGFFLGYLILTKVIFAYVAGCCLILSLVFFKCSRPCRRAVGLYVISLLFCVPYLIYTYSLTGRFFYWANSGGGNLYWMTTPYAKEYGDAKSPQRVFEDERLHRHRELFEKLAGLNCVESDELFKRQAFLNVRRYPLKYCFNWVANVGRMWYAYPFSYKYQRPHTLFYTVPSSFLLVSLLFCCYPLWKRRKHLPGELVVLIALAIIFLVGSSFTYAHARYLKPLVPIFVIVIFFTANNLLEIRFHRETREKLNE